MLEKWISDRTAAGIEVVLKEHETSFNLVVLRRNGNTICIEKKAEGLKTADELKTLIDKKIPVILSITGKGVIHKKISDNERPYALQTLLNKAMPGAALNDFNVQVSEINAEQAFVSLVRSSAGDAAIAGLTTQGIRNIANCFLGPFVLNDVFEQLGITGSICLSTQRLKTDNNVVTEIQPAQSEQDVTMINVGTDQLSSNLLIAFAAAFSHFLPAKKGIENSLRINNVKEEYTAKRKFERRGMTALVAVFILLLINFFVFSAYRDKNNELNGLYALNESAIQRYDTLKKEFSFKKQFLEENGLLEHSKTSFYADQLAKALPASISWTALKINPQKEVKNAEKNSFTFENKVLEIAGKCAQSIDLNEWMKTIRQQPWIDKLTLINYTQTKKTEPGVFTLRLNLK